MFLQRLIKRTESVRGRERDTIISDNMYPRTITFFFFFFEGIGGVLISVLVRTLK